MLCLLFFWQQHTLQTMHHSRSHYNLIKLPFHLCYYSSVTYHPRHSSPPSLTCHHSLPYLSNALSVALIFCYLNSSTITTFSCCIFTFSPISLTSTHMYYVLFLLNFTLILSRAYLHHSRHYSTMCFYTNLHLIISYC